MSDVRFREDQPGDQAWLRDRLPSDRGRGKSFVGESAGRRVACFAVAPPLEAYNPPGLAVALDVETDAPGHQIIRLAATMAERMNLGPLYAWVHPAEGSPAAGLMDRMGFKAFNTVTAYEADVAVADSKLSPLIAYQQSRSPSMVDVRPLRGADPDAVLDVWQRGIGRLGAAERQSRLRLVGDGPRPFDLDLSHVSVYGDEVVGIYLVVNEGAGAAKAEVVAFDSRARTPGDVLELLGPVLRETLAAGLRTMGWDALGDAHFAHRLAKRLSARVVSRRLIMRRPPR